MPAAPKPAGFPASGSGIRWAAAGPPSIRWRPWRRSPRRPTRSSSALRCCRSRLRHPIELAHRAMSVQALSGNRLRLGVGSGSTRADFELLGGDYDQRFRTLRNSLEIMRSGVARRAGQWRHIVAMAGMRRRAADTDRRLAQPALDHLCRQGMPGLDALRPLQQPGGSRRRHARLPRSGRRQRRPRQCRDRPRRAARNPPSLQKSRTSR